jgi:hypothetical protein
MDDLCERCMRFPAQAHDGIKLLCGGCFRARGVWIAPTMPRYPKTRFPHNFTFMPWSGLAVPWFPRFPN